MRRPAVVTAIAFGVVVFLAISLLLARGLSGAGAERAKTLDVLHAEARGDADAVLSLLPACRQVPACATSTRGRVQRLRAAGKVEVLAFDPSARVSLGGGVGSARVAWRAGDELPVVQCVRVRRQGLLQGGEVELLAISAPIARDGVCP